MSTEVEMKTCACGSFHGPGWDHAPDCLAHPGSEWDRDQESTNTLQRLPVQPVVYMEELAKRIEDIRNILKLQGTDGTWNAAPYMVGLYNGLELSLSVLEDRTPSYREVPVAPIHVRSEDYREPCRPQSCPPFEEVNFQVAAVCDCDLKIHGIGNPDCPIHGEQVREYSATHGDGSVVSPEPRERLHVFEGYNGDGSVFKWWTDDTNGH